MNELQRLHAAGQSVWLDFLRRGMLADGMFERMIRDWSITGVTSNPSIFASALRSGDYDTVISERPLAEPVALFYELALDDVRNAADLLKPVWDATSGNDGYVSFELEPRLAHDVTGSLRSAEDLIARIDRPNVMIKVPGTDAGVAVTRELTALGHNVNVTLLFSVPVYERFALAYLEGLEARLNAGHDVSTVVSVASFFVSRVDAIVDPVLPSTSSLRGKVAIANARRAYRRFTEIFSGRRWDVLHDAGARAQRPLWASTGTKDRSYSDVKYVEELLLPKTVTTVPEATLKAFLDHGRANVAALNDEGEVLRRLPSLEVDLEAVSRQLLDAGISAFETDLNDLLTRLQSRTLNPSAA
jgi:transaldolase